MWDASLVSKMRHTAALYADFSRFWEFLRLLDTVWPERKTHDEQPPLLPLCRYFTATNTNYCSNSIYELPTSCLNSSVFICFPFLVIFGII